MKKYFKGLYTKQYGIYHIRWQASAIIMIVPMMILQAAGFPLWLTLSLGQVFGAIIFWEIDKRIFKHHDKDTLEKEITKVLDSTPPGVSERKL